MKTITSLRREFEHKALRCHFGLSRNHKTGEYREPNTFCFWAGYFECAKEHRVISHVTEVRDSHMLFRDCRVKPGASVLLKVAHVHGDLQLPRGASCKVLRDESELVIVSFVRGSKEELSSVEHYNLLAEDK